MYVCDLDNTVSPIKIKTMIDGNLVTVFDSTESPDIGFDVAFYVITKIIRTDSGYEIWTK